MRGTRSGISERMRARSDAFMFALIVECWFASPRRCYITSAAAAGGDQDRELAQPRRQRGAEADVLAQLLRALGQLRAAQQRVERAAEPAARAAGDVLVHLALRLGHLFLRKRLEPWSVAHEFPLMFSPIARLTLGITSPAINSIDRRASAGSTQSMPAYTSSPKAPASSRRARIWSTTRFTVPRSTSRSSSRSSVTALSSSCSSCLKTMWRFDRTMLPSSLSQ